MMWHIPSFQGIEKEVIIAEMFSRNNLSKKVRLFNQVSDWKMQSTWNSWFEI